MWPLATGAVAKFSRSVSLDSFVVGGAKKPPAAFGPFHSIIAFKVRLCCALRCLSIMHW
jgi:hypothetical protein